MNTNTEQISLPKILFKNKEDSWVLNNDSKYVLTAGNINEIKDVVNSLSDYLEKTLKFYEVYAHLRLKMPDNLKRNSSYDIKVELSTNKLFEGEILSFSFLNNKDLFYEFKDNKWINIEDEYLTDKYKNSVLEIYIQNIIKNKGLIYFGRYKLINIETKEESEYTGFCLGSYSENKINDNNLYLKDYSLKEHGKDKLKINLFDTETQVIDIFGRQYNDEVLNITEISECVFSSSSENISIKNNKITIHDVKEPHTCILYCNFKYKNIDYEIKQELMLRPLILEHIKTDLPVLITKETPNKIAYHLNAETNIGSIIKNIENNVDLIPLNTNAIKCENGNFIIDKNQLNGLNKINFIAVYKNPKNSFFNNIIDTFSIDVDVDDIIKLDDELNEDIKELNNNIHKDYILSNAGIYFTHCLYNFNFFGINSNNERNSINENITIENIFNVAGVKILNNKSIIVENDFDTPVLLKITYKNFGKTTSKHKYINFKHIKETEIKVIGNFEVSQNSSETFDFKLYFEDEIVSKNISDNINLSVASGNPEYVSKIDKNVITFSSIQKAYENICIKAEYNNIIKFFIITIKNI